MNVGSVQARNQVGFKSHYIFKVPKTAFKNPDNISQIAYDMCLAAELAVPDKVFSMMDFLRDLCGDINPLKKCRKIQPIFEFPGFEDLSIQAKKCGLSISWLAQHTKIDIPNTHSPNHHSLMVLTKGDKDAYIDSVFSPKANSEMRKKAREFLDKSAETEPKRRTFLYLAKCHEIAMSKLNKILGGKKAQELEVKSLEELPQAINGIDY